MYVSAADELMYLYRLMMESIKKVRVEFSKYFISIY
jgi:hypothetical protein